MEARYLSLFTKITSDISPSDLVVYKNDKVTVSYANERFRSNYKLLNPATIDEVKQLIGIPKHIKLTRRISTARLPAYVPSINDLTDSQRAARAVGAVRSAAKQYVLGSHVDAAQWTGVINDWLARSKVVVRVATFSDIVVEDGAILQVARDTQLLQANAIRLYGNGLIQALGDLTIDCTSLQGYLEETAPMPLVSGAVPAERAAPISVGRRMSSTTRKATT
jgi:hypothetical protein